MPVAVSWPGGPLLALWVDDSDGPYRVVSYDHETSSDRYVDVVAESLGEALEAFVQNGLYALGVTFNTVDFVDADPGFEARQEAARQAEEDELIELVSEPLPDPPSGRPLGELFELCGRYVTERHVGQLNSWANRLSIDACDHSAEWAAERELLVRVALAYVAAHPEHEAALRRDYVSLWLKYPANDEEASWTPHPGPFHITAGGRTEDSQAVAVAPSYRSALIWSLIPGLGHIGAGQQGKGLGLMAFCFFTCFATWVLTPLVAYDLLRVRRAKLSRAVGEWEMFPKP